MRGEVEAISGEGGPGGFIDMMNEQTLEDRDDGGTTTPMMLQYCVMLTGKSSARFLDRQCEESL